MPAPLPPAPAPPPVPTPRRLLANLRQVRPSPPRRWAFALRAALAMGIPILAGIWAGAPSYGLMATLGAFTALYGSGRPYASRAITLAVVACAFALAVMFGLWLEGRPWLVVPALSLVAMLATWLCNAARLGPPGAYMFVLACAAGTALPVAQLSPVQAGLLVLGGGAVAWLLHTAGALFRLRGPERHAVAAAGRAVSACIAAGSAHPGPRRAAAQALQDSWQMLVGFQPIPARGGGELQRLRAVNRELHLLFASAIDPSAPDAGRDDLHQRAQALVDEATRPAIERPRQLPPDAVPHGYPHSWTLLREGIAPGSNALRVVLRVGLATLLAGALAAAFDMERAYWAIAAALLMLHQGFDWPRSVQRSVERTLGTWVGLLLAGAILWHQPGGAWLVLTVMALQFVIEVAVVRNYAIAVVFITGAALTIASGGHPVDDIPGLLLARGLDTLLGCACALFAFRLLPPKADARSLGDGIAQCLLAIRDACRVLASGNVTSPAARAVRRDLQHRSFDLEQRMDDALAGSRPQREAAERLWPGASACQRLAYRVLAACWDAERHMAAGSASVAQPPQLHPDDMPRVAAALEALARAWRQLTAAPPPVPLPPLLQADVDDLRNVPCHRP
ncbi:MAG TPA: FUSC family protein [Luteimonas sp.]|nr:FUSC family protein [Luteimonas sp.]